MLTRAVAPSGCPKKENRRASPPLISFNRVCGHLLFPELHVHMQYFVYLLVLLAMLVVYRTLAMLGLKAKAKNFYEQ